MEIVWTVLAIIMLVVIWLALYFFPIDSKDDYYE